MLSSNLVWSGATGFRKSTYPLRVGPPSVSFISVRPVVRPVARPVALLVVVVRPLPVCPVSSFAVVAVGLLCLCCPSVCPCGFSIMEQRNKLVATSSSFLYSGLCVALRAKHEPSEHVSGGPLRYREVALVITVRRTSPWTPCTGIIFAEVYEG